MRRAMNAAALQKKSYGDSLNTNVFMSDRTEDLATPHIHGGTASWTCRASSNKLQIGMCAQFDASSKATP
jgi:hypothetical protein